MALDPFTAVVPGMIQMWPTNSPPAGWHILAGPVSTCLAADNPGLVAIFGTSGANVNLPDMRDRFPAMPGTDNGAALLNTGGETKHTLTGPESGIQQHQHAKGTLAIATGGTHDHDVQTTGQPVQTAAVGAWAGNHGKNSGTSMGRTQDGGSHTHTLNGSTADVVAKNATSSHENRPKFFTLNFIIKGG